MAALCEVATKTTAAAAADLLQTQQSEDTKTCFPRRTLNVSSWKSRSRSCVHSDGRFLDDGRGEELRHELRHDANAFLTEVGASHVSQAGFTRSASCVASHRVASLCAASPWTPKYCFPTTRMCVFTSRDARSFSALTSKLPPLGSMLNFDADVKKMTARHQCENRH